MDKPTIDVNDTVVLRNADDKSSFILKVNGEQKIGKSRVNLKNVIDLPYATYFELNGRKFQKVENVVDLGDGEGEGESSTEAPAPTMNLPSASLVQQQPQAASNLNTLSDQEIQCYVTNILDKNASVDGIRGDNSFYVDSNTAQKLSDADIIRLREQGLSGEEIIKTLIDNSDTFAYKTDFAQAKWIKRKERKYRKKYQIVRCTPATVCEASFSKNKEKICNMRFDTLAQVLSQAGISSGCRVLIVESTVGMVTGSVAYRMRGHGRILSVYGGQQPHLDMAKYFNLDRACTEIVEPIPAIELGPAAKAVAASGFVDYETFVVPLEKPGSKVEAEDAGDMVGEEAEGSADDAMVEEEQEAQPTSKKRKMDKKDRPSSILNDQLSSTGRSPEAQVRLRSYLKQGVDHLIITSRFRPLPILKVALYLLSPSSPFVIYHEFLEPLVECYLYLQDSGLALRLVMSDTWMREFQTLPGRMRPDMFMSTSGGYLLTGIYVGMVPRPFLTAEAPVSNGESSSSSSSNAQS